MEGQQKWKSEKNIIVDYKLTRRQIHFTYLLTYLYATFRKKNISICLYISQLDLLQYRDSFQSHPYYRDSWDLEFSSVDIPETYTLRTHLISKFPVLL
jgi:hypothetical protein